MDEAQTPKLKTPRETVTFAFDFTQRLGTDTIQGSITAEILGSPATVTTGLPTLGTVAQSTANAKIVLVQIAGGTIDCLYFVRVRVNTVGGQVLEVVRTIEIRDVF